MQLGPFYRLVVYCLAYLLFDFIIAPFSNRLSDVQNIAKNVFRLSSTNDNATIALQVNL